MAWTLVEHSSTGFSDGNAGHVIAFSGGPSAGHLDIVTVNSNTVASTPSGFTLGRSRVNSQGSYIYYRFAAGGESANVTITTSGDHSTSATWSRWAGGNALDVAVDDGVDSSSGLTSPTLSTGTLAATGELVIVLAAMHNLSTGVVPSSPVWSSGFTALDAASDITGPPGTGAWTAAFTGYKATAGTAAESPNVTWTNPATDRYILILTFTAAAGGATQNGAAALTATGTITTTAAASRAAAASLTGTATITSAGAAMRPATAALTATAAITATASVSPGISAAVVATATITATASVTRDAAATLTATATITASAAVAGGAVTHRPNSGTTARPGPGQTGRPGSGVTLRP